MNREVAGMIISMVIGMIVSLAIGVSNAGTVTALITGAVVGGAAIYIVAGGGGGECAQYVPNVPLTYAHPSVVDATIIRSEWVRLYE